MWKTDCKKKRKDDDFNMFILLWTTVRVNKYGVRSEEEYTEFETLKCFPNPDQGAFVSKPDRGTSTAL